MSDLRAEIRDAIDDASVRWVGTTRSDFVRETTDAVMAVMTRRAQNLLGYSDVVAAGMPSAPTRITRCPECVAGKHGNCNGDSWDDSADAVAPCPCPCRAESR